MLTSNPGGGLQNTFLADPSVGIVLLVLVFLLIVVGCILCVMLCYYVRQSYLNNRSVAHGIDQYSQFTWMF